MTMVTFWPMVIVTHHPFSPGRNQREGIVDTIRARSAHRHFPNLNDHSPSLFVVDIVMLEQNRGRLPSHYGNKCHSKRGQSSEGSIGIKRPKSTGLFAAGLNCT